MKYLNFLFLTVVGMVPVPASSQQIDSIPYRYGQTLTIDQAVQTALVNAPDIKLAALAVEKAQKDVGNAWAEVFPRVSAGLNYQRNFEIPVSFLPAEIFGGQAGDFIPVAFGTDNNWLANVAVNQTIFRGEALVGISSATIYKLVQEEQYRAAAQQVVTQTRNAYVTLLFAGEQYRLQRDVVQRLATNLAENQKRLKAGVLNEYEVLRVEVELKNEKPLLTQAENAIQNAFRQLNLAMGMPDDFRFNPVGNLLSVQTAGEAATENRALMEVSRLTPFTAGTDFDWKRLRGDIRTLTASESLKDREIFAYKTRFLPEITAVYNMNWQAVEPGSPNMNAIFSANPQRVRAQTLGLSAQVTLFNGLRRTTIIQKALIEKKELQEQIHRTERQANSEIARAAEAVGEAILLLPAFDDAVATARRGYEIALSRSSNGFATQIDVSNALLQLRRAELSRAQAAYQFLSAKASYDLAVGQVPYVDQTKP